MSSFLEERKDLALEEEENFKGFCIRVNNLDTDISALDAITNRIEDSNY